MLNQIPQEKNFNNLNTFETYGNLNFKVMYVTSTHQVSFLWKDILKYQKY